ncbi:hypothetical protein FOZ62_015500, partial [Perkinsus olseni]
MRLVVFNSVLLKLWEVTAVSGLPLVLTQSSSRISRKLRHLSHCGLNHTWKIDDAVNKLGALGVSAGRFIDSPSFGLGAYKNMQLRFFPKGCGHGPPGAASNIVMQKSAACSVWLVWNPQASNRDARLPPIRVELAVG